MAGEKPLFVAALEQMKFLAANPSAAEIYSLGRRIQIEV